MPSSRREDRVLETYARSLIEVAKAEGRVFVDGNALGAISEASPEVMAIVTTLAERGQLDLLPQISAMYQEIVEDDEDVVGVHVTTAVPLDDDLRESISRQYEADLGSKVFLIEHVDPSIIGGLIVEARGQRRDVSIRTQLRAARDTLTSTIETTGGDAAHV